MGLGALEARWERAFNEPKIIQIGLHIFAGDDFEKIFFEKLFWKPADPKAQNLGWGHHNYEEHPQ